MANPTMFYAVSMNKPLPTNDDEESPTFSALELHRKIITKVRIRLLVTFWLAINSHSSIFSLSFSFYFFLSISFFLFLSFYFFLSLFLSLSLSVSLSFFLSFFLSQFALVSSTFSPSLSLSISLSSFIWVFLKLKISLFDWNLTSHFAEYIYRENAKLDFEWFKEKWFFKIILYNLRV